MSLPAWVSALPLWQWYAIPNTALSSVAPSPTPLGSPAAKITAWNGACLRRLGSVYMLGAAGGHADYAGNEVDVLALNVTTPQWVQHHAPTPNAYILDGPAQYYAQEPDGRYRPACTHTYYASHFIDALDRMFVVASPGLGGLGATCPPSHPYQGSSRTFSYNYGLGEWDVPDYVGQYTFGGDFTAAMTCQNPVTGNIYMARASVATNGGWCIWTRSTNTWTRVSQSLYETNYCASAIDSTRNRILIVGDFGGTVNPRVRDFNGANLNVTFGGLGANALKPNRYAGMVYDEVNDTFLVFDNTASIEVTRVNASTWSVDQPVITGTKPTQRQNGISGAIQYVPELGGVVIANNYSGNVQFMRTSSAGSSVPGVGVTSFQLTSPNTQSGAPFTIGLGFRQGDITAPSLDIADQQVTIKRYWNDGSVKHAIASGQVAVTASTAKTVQVLPGTASAGPLLTAANIATANPSASIQCGSIGTVNLSSLLASPFRTWISGPIMVEAHYRANVGADATLQVWFHVRLYKNGTMWVRAIVENGYLNVATTTKSYIPTIIIGGTTVYNNGGTALNHYAYTRYMAERWIGTDPQITPQHNTADLMATKLVPNYWKRNPSTSILNGLVQTYVPMNKGGLEASMGSAGFQYSLGLLPQWDALYVGTGDARAYRACLTNSSSMNSFPIVWRDSITKLVAKPSAYPTFGLGTYNFTAGPYTWEMNHSPSEGYLAYLLTGDYWHYETMLMHASLCWLALPSSRGSGVNRRLTAETRGTAWNIRNMALLGIAPDGDTIAAEYLAVLAYNMAQFKGIKDTLGGVGIGYLYEYNVDLYAPGTIAPWQQHFWIQSMGFGWDLQPLTDMSVFQEVRDWMYRGAVGICGPGTSYCFNYGSNYNIKISSGGNNNPASWYPDWATVYLNTEGSAACGNTLLGGSAGSPAEAATGYWGNLLPAIVYATEHGAAGAADSWARLTGATNWSALENSGFDDIPNWGLTPRSITVTEPPIEPPPVEPPIVQLTKAITIVMKGGMR